MQKYGTNYGGWLIPQNINLNENSVQEIINNIDKKVQRGINTEKWATEKKTSSSAKQSCTWVHAVDILDRNW